MNLRSIRKAVCLLMVLLTVLLFGCAPASSGPATVSGSIVLSLPAGSEVSEPVTSSEPEADEPVSNGVKLSTFIDKVIEVALKQPQYPVENGATIYGELFGAPKAQWCTEFVMYCLKEAEDALDTEFIGTVYPWRDSAWDTGIWFKKRDRFYDGGSDYIPSRGDIVLFDTEDWGYPDHTAYVMDVIRDGGQTQIVTIEGNIPQDKVKQIRSRTLDYDDPTVLGYCSTTHEEEYKGSLVDYTY